MDGYYTGTIKTFLTVKNYKIQGKLIGACEIFIYIDFSGGEVDG